MGCHGVSRRRKTTQMNRGIVRQLSAFLLLAAFTLLPPAATRAADVTATPPADKPLPGAAGADEEVGGNITRVYDVHDFTWINGTGSDLAAGGDGEMTHKETAAAVMNLIMDIVEQGSWIPQGGTSFIQERDGRLTIR